MTFDPLKGWIWFPRSIEGQQLINEVEALGVQLSEPEMVVDGLVYQTCVVPDEATMKKLDPYFGQLLWGLDK